MHVPSASKLKAKRVIRLLHAAMLVIAFASSPSAATEASMPVPYIEEPVGVASIRYPDTPDWTYFRTSSYCYATLSNGEGRLLVGYNQSQRHFHVGFWSDERLSGYSAHSVTDVAVITVRKLPNGRLGEPVTSPEPWQALVLDNDTNKQVFNIKMARAQGLALLSGAYVLSFVGPDRRFLQSFVAGQSAAAVRRLLTCVPR